MSDRLTGLRAKLRAREGRAEYRENVNWLRVEIARLETAPANEPEPKEWR